MTALHKLSINNLRNIVQADIKLSPGFNVFIGDNGSGKTSILEAIHLLGMAKSFRGSQQKPLIQVGHTECTVYSELDESVSIGVTRPLRGAPLIKVSACIVKKASDLAIILPLQLLNSDTFTILEGSPKYRRKYLDWGVFHVEPLFIEEWRMTRVALHNRNNLLKNKAASNEVAPWTNEFVQHSLCVHSYRESYIAALLPILDEVLSELLVIDEFTIEYYRGWDPEKSLEEVLLGGFARDIKYGYTVSGPHRAEIVMRVGKHAAIDILSRGQQKLLVSALKLAQGLLLERVTSKKCIYLLDDLPAELDMANRSKVCSLLHKFNVQVFITCVEESALDISSWSESSYMGEESKLFHVKHGKISELTKTS